MDKRVFIVLGVIVALFGGLWAYSANLKTKTPVNYGRFEREKIVALSETIDLDQYNCDVETCVLDSDNVEGDASKAKVVLFEYADYECSHCAQYNPTINKLLTKYGDDLAVVFRGYLLSYNDNSTVAASAAAAAGIQGYWQEYKDYLFSNQNVWYALKTDKAAEKFEEYFTIVTDGKGDVAKFHDDMKSEAVAKKLAIDYAITNKVDIEGTPAFYINGENVKISNLESKLKELLKK